MLGVGEMDRSLEQWQMGAKDLRRRMVLAPTPRERERWYAILLLAQGLTAAATEEALEWDPHTREGGRRFVSERLGVSPNRSSCLNYLHGLGFASRHPKKPLVRANAARREAFVVEHAALRDESQRTGT